LICWCERHVIRREHFCNKLNTLNYTFQRQAVRVMIYRKRGSPARVMVPQRDHLDDDYVRLTLSQAGCKPEEIEAFIKLQRVSD
jgi:hypothetical protein